jgi:hypothetical protein
MSPQYDLIKMILVGGMFILSFYSGCEGEQKPAEELGFAYEKKSPKGKIRIPLEPLYSILLENPLHKSP